MKDRIDRKSYEQYCPMATALDYVGDRWTMLIMRELLGGPARFQELRKGLPGIAPNLLTDRLRRLESDQIIRRAESGGSAVYALTRAGEGIRTAVEELAMWGARMGRVRPPIHQRSARAFAMALHSILVRAGDALPSERAVVELEVDRVFIEVALGEDPSVVVRPSMAADARVRTTTEALSDFLAAKQRASDTFAFVAGDESAAGALTTAFGG
jgi:DNA-binding HxlR family transcriptional regulator